MYAYRSAYAKASTELYLRPSDRPMAELADGRWPMAMLTTGDADGDADGDVSCHFRFD